MTVDDEKVVTVVAIHRGPSSAVEVAGGLGLSTPASGAVQTSQHRVVDSIGGVIERPGLSECSSSGNE
jgi:hypothetical protein